MIAEKEKIREKIYAQRDQLVGLAHDIHEHPELAFYEDYAVRRLTDYLAVQGFTVREAVCGIPTAFIATVGNGPLHVAFCAEYDALPPACVFDQNNPPGFREVWLSPERFDTPLRHACGHSLIAGVAVTAAIGLKDIADQLGLKISVFGTPGEELVALPEPREGFLAAGKIALLERGAFDDVHAALMAHPSASPWNMFVPTHVFLRKRARFAPASNNHCLDIAALRSLEVKLKQTIFSFHEMPTLFVAQPEEGKCGAKVDFLWVIKTEKKTKQTCEAVNRCFQETASSAGTAVEIVDYAPGVDLHNDPFLSASFRENSIILGRVREQDPKIQEEIHKIFLDPRVPWIARLFARIFPRLVSSPGLFMNKPPVKVVYGTDLANVSQRIPAIHPSIGVGGLAGPHMAQFADDVDTEEAYRAMLDGGMALAWTALDAACDPMLRAHLLAAGPNGLNSKN